MIASIDDAKKAKEQLLEWKRNGFTHYFFAFVIKEGIYKFICIPFNKETKSEVNLEVKDKEFCLYGYPLEIPKGLETIDLDKPEFKFVIDGIEIFLVINVALNNLASAIANGWKND